MFSLSSSIRSLVPFRVQLVSICTVLLIGAWSPSALCQVGGKQAKQQDHVSFDLVIADGASSGGLLNGQQLGGKGRVTNKQKDLVEVWGDPGAGKAKVLLARIPGAGRVLNTTRDFFVPGGMSIEVINPADFDDQGKQNGGVAKCRFTYFGDGT